MGSSGGGTARAPGQPTPSGLISSYGSSTPFNPNFVNVLPSTGWATPEGIEAATNAGLAQAAANPRPAPSPLSQINPAMLGEFEKMRNQLAALQARNKMVADNERKLLIGRSQGGGGYGGFGGGRGSSSGHSGSARGGAGGGSSARR